MSKTWPLLQKTFKKFRFTSLAIVGALCVTIYYLLFFGKIAPGIYVQNFYLGGKTPEQAIKILSSLTPPQEIIFDNDFKIPLNAIDFGYDIEKTVDTAYQITRTGNIVYDIQQVINYLIHKKQIGLQIQLNEAKLQKNLTVITDQIAVDPVLPQLKVTGGEVILEKGKKGQIVDKQKLRALIAAHFAYQEQTVIHIPLEIVDPSLTPQEENVLLQKAKNLLGKKIVLQKEFDTFIYQNQDLIALLDFKGGFQDTKLSEIAAAISSKINREPQNPIFNFTDGKVKEFAPAKEGLNVKTEDLKTEIEKALDTLITSDQKELTLQIPVIGTPPTIQTSEVNNLGIKELIGRGTSRFKGSIPSRVHNVALAASRLNGVLIKPGEVFSFNNALGDISKLTGFQEAYVINNGKTVLGDGGGVCQVSTTLFRAALNAGLPIPERRAHAYRVGYYEQDQGPGLDATVYSPTTDFKITNDTANYILIQTQTDTQNYSLVFELYGTKDGRIATVTKPVVSGVSVPPADSYVDDPTLPIGVKKQIEHRANGAKVTFNYTVTKSGQITYQKSFVSNYRPWQAVYLVGTKVL